MSTDTGARAPMASLLAALWLLATLLLAVPAARADAVLPLLDRQVDIDAWPHLTHLVDEGSQMTVDDVLFRLDEFTVPQAPRANLGVQHHAVWFRLKVDVPRLESGNWVLNVSYPSLDEVQVYVVTDNRAVAQYRLGRQVPLDEQARRTRAPAVLLHLEPDMEHELLLRVRTASAMIVPVRLVKPEAYHAQESGHQLVQGVAAGIGICLVFYALAHWRSLRERAYLTYALSVAGITLFFLSYHGIGAQQLWAGNAWLSVNAAPLVVLLALAGGLLFQEAALKVSSHNPHLGLAMRVGAGAAAVAALAFLLGLINYRSAQLMSTVLGPLPVLGLPAALHRASAGDRAARYMLAGWALYSVGIVNMALMMRGHVPFNGFTNNAFQVGSLLEMVMWLLALGVRLQDDRHHAQEAAREGELMRSLAYTDTLTGLPNRRGLANEIEARLPQARADALLAVYMLDLDGFKGVNDRLGHDVGDELLKAVAQRLRSLVRASDVVARLGGDEFVVLARDLPGDDGARALGQKLLDGFLLPFSLPGGHVAQVGLTAGYALGPLDGLDPASLLKRADAAMYAGKQAGKHCLRRGQASFGLAA